MFKEGKVFKIINWNSGKGYFLMLEKDPVEYYSFGSAKMKVDQLVKLDVKTGTGNFAQKMEIKGWEENAPILKDTKEIQKPKEEKKEAEPKQELTNMVYREYQIEVMNNCINDAAVSAQGTDEDIIPVACAFFDKRCKPYYYFELAGKNEFIRGGKVEKN